MSYFPNPSPKENFPELEKKIIEKWRKEKTFKKSVDFRNKENNYTFYDGPPFATGLPHYGHLLAGTIKDVIPRYQTMIGKKVPRRFGWDCHGLPVEFEKEKELGISGKHDIENLPEKEINGEKVSGIARFCEECRSIVLRYTKEWEKTVERMGRWVDFQDSYRTMDPDFMESIWWVFAQLHKKGLIYEGQKVLPYCPRCATPLSNFEANQNYKQKQDPSVTLKFKLKDEKDTFFLAWTTTPWTLPSNLALAVGKDIEYVKIQMAYDDEETKLDPNESTEVYYGKEQFILAKDLLEKIFKNAKSEYKIIKTFKGKDLIGKSYEPLFNYFSEKDTYENVPGVYFITFNTANNFNFFDDEEKINKCAKIFREVKEKYDYKIYNLVIMPNHVHLVLEIEDEKHSLPKTIQNLKGYSSKKMKDLYPELTHDLSRGLRHSKEGKSQEYLKFWQKKYDKKFITNKKSYDKIKQYIYQNPEGKDLPKQEYNWLTPEFDEKEIESSQSNNFKVVSGDFVSTEDGTGIVHIAPAFGEDDAKVGEENNIEPVNPVDEEGKFTKQVVDFAGKNIFDANPEIIRNLKERDILFDQKTYDHSYPHCWRCESPLIYKGISTWFVRVSEFREKLLKSNEQINWFPSHIKHGRFGKWLENARDWAISRNRYWGTPLPIWKCSCGETFVPDSLEDLSKKIGACEAVFIRHGEWKGNVEKYTNSSVENPSPLTQNGIKQVEKLAKDLKDQGKFDLIISSDLERTRLTSEILAKNLGLEIEFNKKVREWNFGDMDGDMGENIDEYILKGGIDKKFPNGESFSDVKKRVNKFADEIAEKYKGKRILVVSHAAPILAAKSIFGQISDFKLLDTLSGDEPLPKNTSTHKIFISGIKKNFEGKVDLHKHFMDGVSIPCKNCKETQITFLRHGETGWNKENRSCGRTDIELSEKGLSQAKEVSEILKNERFDAILASPLKRAQKTAEIAISKMKNPPEIIIEENLIERDFGEREGVIAKENEKETLEIRLGNYNNTGESVEDVISRTKKVFEKYSGKRILVVSHGHVLMATKVICNGISKKKSFSSAPPNAEPIDFKFTPSLKRIPEVLDCWFESGSMPYAAFKIKDKNHKNFPANFIAEGLDQTRGWFYTLTVLSSALFESSSFSNCVVNGIILAEDGNKMSKSKKNFPDPNEIIKRYGADSLRIYLMSSPAVRAEDLRFSEKGVEEKFRKIILPLWNAYSFFCLYANIDGWKPKEEKQNTKNLHLLDKWILSELNLLIKEVREKMDNYDLSGAAKNFENFLDALNNFYIRRSRRRFWKSENDIKKTNAYQTLFEVLSKFSMVLSPFCPFITENIFLELTKKESVHLENFPEVKDKFIDQKLSERIKTARQIISLGLLARAKSKIKIRQPLKKIEYKLSGEESLDQTQIEIISEELNVKEVFQFDKSKKLTKILKPNARIIGKKFGVKTKEIFANGKSGNFEILENGNVFVAGEILEKQEFEIEFRSEEESTETFFENGVLVSLDLKITEDLEQEGIAREFIRKVQDFRKEVALNVDDRIEIKIEIKNGKIKDSLEKFKKYICTETLCKSFLFESTKNLESIQDTNIDNENFSFGIRKI